MLLEPQLPERFFVALPTRVRRSLLVGNTSSQVQEGGVFVMTDYSRKKRFGWVYCAYIMKNGKRVYPKNARCFRFFVGGK